MACYQHAWIFSRDPSTKNGAVIFPKFPHSYFAAGVNAFPDGVAQHPDRYADRDLKMKYTVHAEVNAVATAAKCRVPTGGAWMYCPWAACPACAGAIIQSGIAGLTVHRQAHERTPARWKIDIDIAIGMFRERGIVYEEFDGGIGDCKSLINGEEWKP